MSFKFMYNDSWYKYENGKIMKQSPLGLYDNCFDRVCPVLIDLQNQLEAIPEDVRPLVMQGLLHAFNFGVTAGEKKKITEFKRVFALD